MRKIIETLRYVTVLFAIGFIFGILLECTIRQTWTINVIMGIVWGIAVVVIVNLNGYANFILAEKTRMRKEEQEKLIKELDGEIGRLKEKIPRLISTKKAGDMQLASIYVDRVIELEKLKQRYLFNIPLGDDSINRKGGKCDESI